MDFPLLAVLAFTTFALVIGFIFWGKTEVENKMDDPQAPKSALAKDGPGPNPFHPDR